MKSSGHVVKRAVGIASALLMVAAPLAPAMAQVTTVDPDAAIDSDLNRGTTYSSAPPATAEPGNGTPVDAPPATDWNGGQPSYPAPNQAPATPPPAGTVAPDGSSTYREDDLIGAAEGVFGKGAKGLADIIKDLLAKQGQPNAYIVGREAGGAIAVGLRYGSGTLHHKVEGDRPVYWTGPSIGFDAGANAGNAFVLVYNLYDTQDLFHRFGAGEGQAYLVGGFTVSYLRRGNTVLIPVRAGAGLRLGANIGYMKFSEKQRWLPF
ncbi:EipA family protein [Novosphingobium resinovorum]|uniref:EipA family protein n=1 Tax=Novosphingobium resinovorum TaxID=158500 RepID=UPI002ECFB970|nr:EipA family protein [Novosphingobium resinovorum]